MGRQDDLEVRGAPRLREHRGQDPHDRVVEGELGLLQQQDPRVRRCPDDGPQQADEPQSAVGEVDLVLSRRGGPPVLVAGDRVRSAGGVRLNGQGLESGHRRAQGLLHAPEPGITRSGRGRVHLGDEIAPEGVVSGDDGARGVADDLRDEVEVLDSIEVVGDGAEPLIGRDLLEVRLGQEGLIRQIPVIGAPEQFRAVPHDQLLVDDGTVSALPLALDGEPVPP